jgi:hypothetical protein
MKSFRIFNEGNYAIRNILSAFGAAEQAQRAR